MANEILKDEILSEEQLEQVAGGTCDETLHDMNFFNALIKNGINVPANLHNQVGPRNLSDVFKHYGINLSEGVFTNNGYNIDGQKYPRMAALGWVLGAVGYPGYNGNWGD